MQYRSGRRFGTVWDSPRFTQPFAILSAAGFCPLTLIRLTLVSHGAFGEADAEKGAGNEAKPLEDKLETA